MKKLKTKNLKSKVVELCVKLNLEGIKSYDNDIDWSSPSLNEMFSNKDWKTLDWKKIDWKIIENYPNLTFKQIYMNDEAFYYLRKNGYIDTGICWFCGEEPMRKEYTFSTTVTKSIPIC